MSKFSCAVAAFKRNALKVLNLRVIQWYIEPLPVHTFQNKTLKKTFMLSNFLVLLLFPIHDTIVGGDFTQWLKYGPVTVGDAPVSQSVFTIVAPPPASWSSHSSQRHIGVSGSLKQIDNKKSIVCSLITSSSSFVVFWVKNFTNRAENVRTGSCQAFHSILLTRQR